MNKNSTLVSVSFSRAAHAVLAQCVERELSGFEERKLAEQDRWHQAIDSAYYRLGEDNPKWPSKLESLSRRREAALLALENEREILEGLRATLSP